jgi:GcrA cell cycle regulator
MTTWTEERVEALRRLWADGLSASDIAAKVGVTRSAVCGKLARLGLTRDKAAPRTASRPRRAASRPKPAAPGSTLPRARDDTGKLPALPLPPTAPEDIPRVATLDLEPHHCRWVCGDPLEVGASAPLFCGARKLPSLPYCEAHARRAFNGPMVRQRVEVEPARELEPAA